MPVWGILEYMINRISINEPGIFEHAIEVIRSGGIIVYPTETCYGLGCDAENKTAVERLFKIKARESDKPVLVIAEDMSVFLKYVQWNEVIDGLARMYWPGALTIVATLKIHSEEYLAPGVIGSDHTLAFRVTSHPFAANLAHTIGSPLVSTSANISSYPNPYEIDYIVSMFSGREVEPDLIIDAGDLVRRSPSTIVRVEANGEKVILRQGEIVIE